MPLTSVERCKPILIKLTLGYSFADIVRTYFTNIHTLPTGSSFRAFVFVANLNNQRLFDHVTSIFTTNPRLRNIQLTRVLTRKKKLIWGRRMIQKNIHGFHKISRTFF